MGLKDWLRNDNASELFSLRKVDFTYCREQAQKAAKGSIATGSALLFGSAEQEGLLKRVGQTAGKFSKVFFASNSHDDDQQHGGDNCFEHRWDGVEGPGYYSGNTKVEDENDE